MASKVAVTADDGIEYLPYDFEGLTVQLRRKAEKELNENEEVLRNGLMQIKTRIKEENLTTCSSDDFVQLFLRVKKYNLKRSYKQLKQYSNMRHKYMKYYGFMIPDNVMPVFAAGVCGILPKRDQEGRVIIFFRTNQIPTRLNRIFTADDVLRAVLVVAHFVLADPVTQVSGISVIADTRVDSAEVLQIAFKYVSHCLPKLPFYPIRIQKVDLLNTNKIIRGMANALRPLIPSKILKRTIFHKPNTNDLLKSYDASLLPEEFGGSLGPIHQLPKDFMFKIERYIEVLQASNRYFTRKNTVPYPKSSLQLSGFFQ